MRGSCAVGHEGFRSPISLTTGDILVFASGVEQIHKIANKVAEALDPKSPLFSPRDIDPLTIHKLYDTLPVREQEAVARSVPPPPRDLKLGRNLIIATSTAETSIALVGACPEYWANVDTKPAGHIRHALVEKIMELNGLEAPEILGDMPPPPQQQQ